MEATAINGTGWLRNRSFDLFFIVGIAATAIVSGLLCVWNEDLFLPILVADLWILGYHHVISTYTRLTFDSESFRQHKHLVLLLLPAVAVAVAVMVKLGALWLVPTIYLYWQWWHYTRQSEGISKAYAGKSRDRNLGDPRILRATFYAVPLAGILVVSWRSPESFLFMPLKTLPVPEPLMLAAVAGAAALLVMWAWEQFKSWRTGNLAVPYVLYVVSHFAIYAFAYVFVEEINYGWLIINIWHNAQYILFVWLFNNRRFKGQVDRQHVFLSTISQNGRFALYFVTCLTLSTVVYFLVDSVLSPLVASTLTATTGMAAIIIYQTINFHHYIVDSRIWKLRKAPIKKTLGIK